jgi:threonine synthase
MKISFLGFRCSLCQSEYSPDEVTYTCPKDGGNLDVILDYEAIRRKTSPQDLINQGEPSLWRYLPLLPVTELFGQDQRFGQDTPLRQAGHTPVYAPQSLARQLGLKNLWIKDESRNPTASFKDRASAVVVARARHIQADVVVTASTGNAGAALAGMAAAVGQKAVIFAPHTAPPAKVAQLLVYGARVLLVDGTYDDAFDLTIQASAEFGWYCRNTGYNPFTLEGKKTAAFEIWDWWQTIQQSNQGNLPLPKIFVSVGDGNIISGLHKGFKDLLALGWIDKIPAIYGVQAEGSAAVANAFNQSTEVITPVSASTLADSISVDLPRDGVRAVRAARETGGRYILVKDQDILQAIASLGTVGIFAEPAGATGYAGLSQAVHQGLVQPDDAVLVLNTGSGLKDVRAAMQAVTAAPIIQPTLDAVKPFLA